MTKRRRYDDEFRANAVLWLQGAGYPNTPGALQKVSERLGVPAMTLSRWFKGTSNPPPNELVSIKKEDFVNQLLAIRGLAATHITQRIEEFEPRDLTGLLKISAELAELLQGEPTNRIEHTDGNSIRQDIQQKLSRYNDAREPSVIPEFTN